MSNRHRRRRPDTPAAVSPNRRNRADEHRRVRHSVHTDLHLLSRDPDIADEVTLDRPHHTRVDVDRRDLDPVKEVKSKRFKVWKTKAWKRRKLELHRRNEAIAQLKEA